ncbi:MAG: T9SS type A sorting domain-containing protein [Melioribacteraceae bacterium]|nr:T9SS type A sorting domain-containing protein [Melioribacteraceae bacterium]
MKRFLIVFLMLFTVSGFFAQEKVLWDFDEEPLDTSFWAKVFGDNSDSTLHNCTPSFTSDAVSGAGSMQIDYTVQNSESWGGFGKIEHYHPDSNSVYDWSAFDTLSFWYKNVAPQSDPGQVHLRVNLYDVSDAPDGNKTYDSGEGEFYYSFEYILDDSTNEWTEFKIALDWNPDNAAWNGEAFNRTGWSGVAGNNILDKDKIKGFCFEFSIGGGGDGNTCTGTILIDKIALKGAAENPLVFFNGAAIPSTMELFQWGGTAELVEGAGNNPESPNALKWVQNDAWTGYGFNLLSPANLSLRWNLDTLKFKMKAEDGVGTLRLQFEDGAAKIGANFDPTTDGEWHSYEFPLTEMMTYFDGTADFNFDSVKVLQILTEGNGSGKTVYMDDWWTGTPFFDLINPEAPQNVTAIQGTYINTVTWDKVPGEVNEAYSIYYSLDPITDVTAAGVEVLTQKFIGELLAVDHVLRAPGEDQVLEYYYAVICFDAAGNESPVAVNDVAISNTAEGVPYINMGAPSNFVADGDLADWAGVTPIVVSTTTNTAFYPANQAVDGDDDCSVVTYIAFDDDYLYVAFDVTDDEVSPDVASDSWMNDAPDLFIGFYDWHGAAHGSYKTGDESDYHFRFNKAQAILDNVGSKVVAKEGTANYYWEEGFLGGYVVEAKFSLDSLADASRNRFHPVEGMRIPLDISVNDADGEPRTGIITYSPNNEDQSHVSPARWSYTWIGDKMTDVNENTSTVISTYELEQNYPNPFNPSTNINFSIPVKGLVTLSIFNVLGEKVTDLVNEELSAGTHTYKFNASVLSTGIYFYSIKANDFVQTRKMMLIK